MGVIISNATKRTVVVKNTTREPVPIYHGPPGEDALSGGAVRQVDADDTLTIADFSLEVDTRGGDVTITLPPIADCWNSTHARGRVFNIIKPFKANRLFLFVPDGGVTIMGSNSFAARGVATISIQAIYPGNRWDII